MSDNAVCDIIPSMKQMHKVLMSLVVSSLASSVMASDAEPFRTIQRIWATEPEKIEKAMSDFPGAFSDGVIISAFVGLKIGPEEVRDFEKQKAFVERMKARGEEVQICLSSTIGHVDTWTEELPYPKMVGANGKAARTIACPRAAEFAEYLRVLGARYARLGPSVIWLDDDFRMMVHNPVDFGCFCPECLSRFAAEYGLKMTREEIRTAILSDGTRDGVRVRTAWRKFTQRALTDLAGVFADAVHAVDNKIAIGYMCCNPQNMGYAPCDFKAWIERTRNKDGVVWFRHGSRTYNDFMPYSDDGIVAKNIAIGRACAMTEGLGVVNMTEEVTSPYNRRTKSLRITFLEAALNIGLAGASGVTYDAIKPNLDEQLRGDALVADIHARRAELERMRALVAGKRQIGVYPFYDQDIWLCNGKAKSLWDMGVLGAEDWKPLLYIGVPFTFREQHASLLLLSGRSARAVPKDKLASWGRRGIMADGLASKELGGIEGKKYVFGKDAWSRDVWGRKASLEIKDALDRLAGGRMCSRVDTCVRLAQSVWESADGTERVVILFNLDFDDAKDVRLVEDGEFASAILLSDGKWQRLGVGSAFSLPLIPAWSTCVVRMKRLSEE